MLGLSTDRVFNERLVFVSAITQLLDLLMSCSMCYLLMLSFIKGDSRARHLQGKRAYTGLVRQAWVFSLFGHM